MKRTLLAIAAALSLAACATPTPYQPLQTGGGGPTGGYSELKVSKDRFRVTFQGNTVTDRDTVERYLLYRAAELTRAEGYDWFTLADRNTERQSREYLTSNDPFGYRAWQPSWYYMGNNRWVLINTPDPFFAPSYERQRIDQFRATAEILLGHGAKPAADTAAFDAADVIANLGPTIHRPEAT
jgi:hypothetical protein